ncbi:kin of irre-like protein 3 [Plakobranchus ocellatus]|uniref:Kin of irre-like protein 3 n=1 Tax=Plakobranchus ocellatus TaxID=259542 RepID=A0AAV4BB74_9GAST|nr:kin of irre-like protein 3 [Plakobranchus ocellatus]
MRRLASYWIIVLFTAFMLMMPLLSGPPLVEGMDTPMAKRSLKVHHGKGLSKSLWRLKRTGATRKAKIQDVTSSKDHAHRLHDTPTIAKSDRLRNRQQNSRIETRTDNSWSFFPSKMDIPNFKAQALPLLKSSNTDEERTPKGKAGPTPEFVFVQPIVVVQTNSLAVLPCSVKNLGDRGVVWRNLSSDGYLTIDKMVWNSDPRVFVDYKLQEDGVTTWDLLIKRVRPSDAGMYECQVTTSERIVLNVELKIEDRTTTMKPKTRVMKKVTQRDSIKNRKMEAADQRHSQKKEFITAGKSIQLVCKTTVNSLSSASSAGVTWFKDGQAIKSSKHTLLTRYEREEEKLYVNELYIDKTSLGDSGEYHCRLQDKVIDAVMIHVLPNTTIGSETQDSRSTYYSVSSLTTENKAMALLNWQTHWLFVLVVHMLPFLFTSSFSSFFDLLAFVIHRNTKIVDQT